MLTLLSIATLYVSNIFIIFSRSLIFKYFLYCILNFAFCNWELNSFQNSTKITHMIFLVFRLRCMHVCGRTVLFSICLCSLPAEFDGLKANNAMNYYIQLYKVRARTLLDYVFVIDISWFTAMKLRSAVLTFPLMHVITVIIYSLLSGNA